MINIMFYYIFVRFYYNNLFFIMILIEFLIFNIDIMNFEYNID